MEKTLTNKIINKLNKNKAIWVRKRYNSGMTGTKGWPDITGTICLNNIGVRIEIEVKQPGKKPTKIQYARLRRFRKLGCIAFWTDDFKKAQTQFKYWCDNIGCVDIHQIDLWENRPSFVINDLKP